MVGLSERKVDWEKDRGSVIDLFKTTWVDHPVTGYPFYKWQFRDCCHGEAIGYCAVPDDQPSIRAGVYLVLPSKLKVEGSTLDFSISMYTMTHPLYYKKGIFKRLATLTYNECLNRGIIGTVGVPNNNSLPGFTKGLKFNAIGQFEIFGKLVSLGRKSKQVVIRKITTEYGLRQFKFSLIENKAKDGVVLFDRNANFIKWRFFDNPKTKYSVFASIRNNNEISGVMVLRKAIKKRIPVTVIVDFLVDHTLPESHEIAGALLSEANLFAIKSATPGLITLGNPSSFEANFLISKGFLKIPKLILPHESNFITKLHAKTANDIKRKIEDFKSWYFSFADFDIF